MAPGKLTVVEHAFASRDEASRRAADFMARSLRDALADDGRAAMVVSGGTSPVQCFDYLARTPLQWEAVRVLLSDERWVPPTDDASNEKLVRTRLLCGEAASADLLGIYAGDSTPDDRCPELDRVFETVARPAACTLLGMGTDGHFASLFPDADNLARGLDLQTKAAFLPVRTAASPHVRISMTLAALLETRALLLLIFGEDKREICRAAAAGIADVPVAALLRQQRVPLHVFWAE